MNQKQEVLRHKDVTEAIGLSKSTIWRMRKAGEFPQPIVLSKRAVGWRREDIEEWLENRKEAE